MNNYDVAIIGTGPDPANPTVEGFAMGYRHAEAYRENEQCQVIACVDIVPENRQAFAEEFGIDEEFVYEDFREMLTGAQPDIVSVTVPPAIHEEVVIGCAQSDVTAIHCEKPIAHTWESAQRIVQTCWRHDTQLTFNRQRRFARPFTEAKRLLDDGEIGDLKRVEISWGDFYDTGAHTVDLTGMFNEDRPAEWVIAQLDYRKEDIRFGAHQENQMFAQWKYDNGVHGVMTTGAGSDLIDAAFLLRGTEGAIRIDVEDGPMLEIECEGSRKSIGVNGENMHMAGSEEGRFGSLFQNRSVADVVQSLETDEESVLSGRIGLNTAEILFGGYESVRRRGRIDFPLDIADNPLEEMVSSGALTPETVEDED